MLARNKETEWEEPRDKRFPKRGAGFPVWSIQLAGLHYMGAKLYLLKNDVVR